MSARVECRTPSAKPFSGAGKVALALQQASEVVAGDRLLPAVPGRDAQREHLVEPLRPFAHADVAEHQARGPAGEHPQRHVAGAVGDVERPLGLEQRLGVGAGEEAEVRLERRDLDLRLVAAAQLGLALGLGGQRDGAAQVAAVERDRALERERAGAQIAGLERARALLAPDGRGERALGILPVDAARLVERAAHAVDVGDGGHRAVFPCLGRASGDLSRASACGVRRHGCRRCYVTDRRQVQTANVFNSC
jgi:hypothetical protein